METLCGVQTLRGLGNHFHRVFNRLSALSFLVSLEPFSTKHAMPSRAVTPPLVCTLPSIRDPTVVCGKDTRDSLAAGGPRTVSGHSLPNHSALTGRSSLRQAMLDHLRSHKRPTRGKIDCQYCLYAGLRSVSSRQLFQELGPVLNPFLLQTMEATHKQSHLVRKKLLCDCCRNASYDHSCVSSSSLPTILTAFTPHLYRL